jgi:hypothetical protein
MSESEFEEIRQASDSAGQTISEWVRSVLRQARRDRATGEIALKLSAIRSAADHSFPTAEIDQMLDEIKAGYL